MEQSTLVVYVEEKSETAAVPVKQKNIFAGRAVVSGITFHRKALLEPKAAYENVKVLLQNKMKGDMRCTRVFRWNWLAEL